MVTKIKEKEEKILKNLGFPIPEKEFTFEDLRNISGGANLLGHFLKEMENQENQTILENLGFSNEANTAKKEYEGIIEY